MPRMFASDPHCKWVTVDSSGKRYNADRKGFISVDDAGDARRLKAEGYVQVGNTPSSSRYWLCECGWEGWINHCPRCDRDDLTLVEE